MKKGGIVHLVGESKKPKSKTKNRFRPYQHGAQIERLKLPITCDKPYCDIQRGKSSICFQSTAKQTLTESAL